MEPENLNEPQGSTESGPPKCPDCSRSLMSRTSPLCSWCGAKIPDELRFSAEEIRKLEEEEEAARQKRLAREAELEKKRKKKALLSGAVDLASLLIGSDRPTIKPPDEKR